MSSRTLADQCLVLLRKLKLSKFNHPEESAWVVVVEMKVWVDFCSKRYYHKIPAIIPFPNKNKPAEIVEIKILPKLIFCEKKILF